MEIKKKITTRPYFMTLPLCAQPEANRNYAVTVGASESESETVGERLCVREGEGEREKVRGEHHPHPHSNYLKIPLHEFHRKNGN